MSITGKILTLEQVEEMVTMQDTLNRAIDPTWRDKDNNYFLAIQMETAEAIEHLGWKWWKKQEPDMAQVQLEIVDIWHFVLCEYIKEHGSMLRASGCLSLDIQLEAQLLQSHEGQDILDSSLLDVLVALLGYANKRSELLVVSLFGPLLQKAGMTWEGLYRQYLLKNTLNIFRQNNGYNLGTYQKIWNGKEDNEYLASVPSECNTFPDVYMDLELVYSAYCR